MGIWGTGIYSNDTAIDVRDACNEIFSYYSEEEGTLKLLHYFKEVVEQDPVDNECASFWYALSDWQWKHGMLNEFVKKKALELLDVYAGVDEWIENENKSDLNRRYKVLDKLKFQLQSQQPNLRKPKFSLAKAKHKPGDIIIFRATEFIDEYNSSWHICNIRPPFIFASDYISKSKYENINGYKAHGKYMAILCVGTQKKTYSEYISEAFDEYSLYVWYNYLSESKPSVEELTLCGFLPAIKWRMKDYSNRITESISWVYRFTLMTESFKSNAYIEIDEKKNNLNEVDRYEKLLSYKKYSDDYDSGYCLTTKFNEMFEEASRMKLLRLKIDDLLDPQTTNPELLQPFEIDQAEIEYSKAKNNDPLKVL